MAVRMAAADENSFKEKFTISGETWIIDNFIKLPSVVVVVVVVLIIVVVVVEGGKGMQ